MRSCNIILLWVCSYAARICSARCVASLPAKNWTPTESDYDVLATMHSCDVEMRQTPTEAFSHRELCCNHPYLIGITGG